MSIFSFFPQCFQKSYIYWVIKRQDCFVKGEALFYF